MTYYKALSATCFFFIALALLSGAALVLLSLEDENREPLPPSSEALSGAAALAPVAQREFSGENVSPQVNFSSYPRAIPQRVRRLLEEEAALPPNFAGHYRVAQWRCGERCRAASVINKNTGDLVVHGMPFTRMAFRVDDPLWAVYWGARGDLYTMDQGALVLVAKLDARGSVTLPSQCPELPLRAFNPATGEEREFASPCRVPAGWNTGADAGYAVP